MYTWIWRHLPGGLASKLVLSLLLFAAVTAILFAFVFPAVEPLLPFQDVTVDAPDGAAPEATGPPVALEVG